LVKLFIEEHGARVVLVPHVYGNVSDPESDPAACQAVFDGLSKCYPDKLFRLVEEYDHHQIKYLIGKCDFFLGSRMHACIAALSQGVPAVGLAYSRKFQGVLGSIGAGNSVIDLRNCQAPEILERVRTLFENRAATRRTLEERLPEVRDSVARLFLGVWREESQRSSSLSVRPAQQPRTLGVS
jgi:colanic acid/amylovoran biosynthesis protein